MQGGLGLWYRTKRGGRRAVRLEEGLSRLWGPCGTALKCIVIGGLQAHCGSVGPLWDYKYY